MKQKKDFNKKIKTRFTHNNGLELGGWYSGKQTYLWMGLSSGRCLGIISGQSLYRLAKTIVKEFEKKE